MRFWGFTSYRAAFMLLRKGFTFLKIILYILLGFHAFGKGVHAFKKGIHIFRKSD